MEFYTPTYISSATETVIHDKPCKLGTVVLGETAAGTITIYDGVTAALGTIKAVLKASIAEQTFDFGGAVFSKGLVIVTAAASKLTVNSRPN